MPTVSEIADAILEREGGYVNDPDDPGGATKYGVTIHTMRRLGLDLTGDGRVSSADVRRLSLAQAKEIFIQHYFHAPGISTLPEALHATVFDMQVNAGANAVKILQRLLVKMGFRIAVDGRIGPQTRAAALKAAKDAPEHLADAYGIERRNYYYALADRRPGQPEICAPPRWRQGRVDPAGGGIHLAPVPPECRRACSTDAGVAMIGDLLGVLLGGGRNAFRETVEVFRPNAEAQAVRDAAQGAAALSQFAAEFQIERRGWFDRFIDGLNRLPRPMLALGTLGLFVSAMVDPVWFAARMQGIALVPEPALVADGSNCVVLFRGAPSGENPRDAALSCHNAVTHAGSGAPDCGAGSVSRRRGTK